MFEATPLALCLALLFPVVSYVLYCEIKYKDIRDIPGPLIARYTNAWRTYLAWKYAARPNNVTYHEVIHNRYGDVVRVGPKTIFTRDPEAIPCVLGFKQRLEKSDSVIAFTVPGIHTSLVGIRNEQKHGAYRRPIQGAYSLSSLKMYEPAVDEMIEVLVKVLDRHAVEGARINISAWCHYFAYDTIMKVTFGAPIGFLENGKDMYNLIENQAKHVAYVKIVTQMPLLDSFLKKNPIYLAFKKQKESPFFQFAVTKIREQREKPDAEFRTLLAHFLDARSKYPNVVDDTQVRLYCSTNTLAGSLSPSRVLDVITRWLSENPGPQDRLYEEIHRSGCAFPVSLESTMKMPYLEGVIREGYRLHHHSDIAIERSVDEQGIELPDGRRIPHGIDVGITTGAMRFSSIYGDRPAEFRPERWMQAKGEGEEEYRARRAAMERIDLTFSAGSRSCIGKNFTHLELFKAIATLVGQFRFESVRAPKPFDVPVRVTRR